MALRINKAPPPPALDPKKLYKVLNHDGRGHVTGSGIWKNALPKEDRFQVCTPWGVLDASVVRPGEWVKPHLLPGQKLEMCRHGLHLADGGHILGHAYAAPRGGVLYEAEARGDFIQGDNKSCHAEARLLRPVANVRYVGRWNEAACLVMWPR